MTTRREFITLLGGGAAAWPVGAWSEQTEGMKRIGVIIGSTTPENAARVSAFEGALQLSGWQKDGNVQIDYRWSEADPERIHANATEIVALRPDVILAQATPTVATLLKITRSIPIIFVHVSDPIGSGFVESFAHPGG